MDQITLQENALFRRWADKRDGPFMQDGVPFPEDYKSSSIRTVFVFREANHGENPKSEDLRSHLRTNPRRDFWLSKVSPWCHGLTNYSLNVTRTWKETQAKDFDRAQALRPFGFVQIKKVPGASNAVQRELKQFAQEDTSLLRKQLSIYLPDVIIACGISGANMFDLLLDTVFLGSKKRVWPPTNRRKFRYAEIIDAKIAEKSIILIENCHPSSRGAKFEIYKGLVTMFRQVKLKCVMRRM